MSNLRKVNTHLVLLPTKRLIGRRGFIPRSLLRGIFITLSHTHTTNTRNKKYMIGYNKSFFGGMNMGDKELSFSEKEKIYNGIKTHEFSTKF
jgi:hypothetical protein